MPQETSEQRVARLNEFAQVWDVEVDDEANGRTIALFRCTQMVLLPKA